MTEPKPYYGCLDRPKGEVLKPCPFCGGMATLVMDDEFPAGVYEEYYIKCGKCKMKFATPTCGKNETVKAWNRRVKA